MACREGITTSTYLLTYCKATSDKIWDKWLANFHILTKLNYLSTLYNICRYQCTPVGRVGNRYVYQGGQTENQGGQTNFIKQMFAHPGVKPCRRPCRVLFPSSKTTKMIKVLLLRAPCQIVNVLLGICCFQCINQCRIAVNSAINCSLFQLYLLFLYISKQFYRFSKRRDNM